jgi:lipopolysaccharide export system protein LptC
VRAARILLPLAALGALSSMFLISRDDFPAGIRFSAADFASLGEGLRLANPRFTGATERGEPFTVSAEWALPDAPDPREIALHAVRAEIVTADGRTVTLTAAEGILRPRDQRVALAGGVTVTTSDGYRAGTEAAEADVRARTLVAPGPVVAEGPLGRIEAGRMTVARPAADDGDRAGDDLIVFENRVRVVYLPGTAGPGVAGTHPADRQGK